MQQGSKYILFIGLGTGCISILYFISLILHLPFAVTVPLVAIGLYFLFMWLNKEQYNVEQRPIGWLSFAIVAGCFAALAIKADQIGERHGAWDAWATWNLHAIYLTDPEHWKNMFLNVKFDHADYPLALPATIAFFSRMAGQFYESIAFAFHFLITLCIPLLIFLEIRPKSIIIAAITFILFAFNEFYIMQGTYQLADTLLAFFFLCALVAINHHKEDKRMLVLAAAFLGCSMWTKNEGIILVIIFTLFHIPELFGRYRVKYTLMGIAVPFIVWLLFKLVYAPPSDMVHGQSGSTMQFLLDTGRYRLIYDHFSNNLQYFKEVKWAVAIYVIICILKRQWPSKQMFMVAACLLAYMSVYLISHYNLDWHLSTSQSRLMHQLMPAFIYLIAQRLAGKNKATASFQARFVSVRQRLR